MANVITEKFEKELAKFFKWANQSDIIVVDKKNGDKKVDWGKEMINYNEPARNKLEIFLKGVIEAYSVYENETLIDDNKLLTVKYKLNKPKRKNAKKNVQDNIEETEDTTEDTVVEKVSKTQKKEKVSKTQKKEKVPKTQKMSKKETMELTESLENMKIKDNENAKNQEFEKVFDNNVPEPKMYNVQKGQVEMEDIIERIKCNYKIDLQGLI